MPNFKSQTDTQFTALDNPEASEISINGTTLEPIPFVSINREEYKAGSYVVGGVLNLTLDGFHFGTGFSETSTGISTISAIAETHSSQGYLSGINIKCGDTYIIQNGVGSIQSLTFDQGPQRNWMNVIPYNIQLQIYETGGYPVVAPYGRVVSNYNIWDGTSGKARGINGISENYTISLDENAYYHPLDGTNTHSNRHIKLQFSLSANGASSLTQHNDNYGIKGVNAILSKRLEKLLGGLSSMFMDSSNAISLTSAGFSNSGKLSKVSYTIDELNNTASINGEIIYLTTANTSSALVSMNLDHNNSIESADEGFTINGTIQGLANQFIGTGNTIFEMYNNVGFGAMNNAEEALKNILINGSGLTIPQDLINTNKNNPIMKNSSGVGELGGVFYPGGAGVPSLSLYVTSAGYNPDASYLVNVTNETNNFRLISKSLKRNYNNNSIDFSLTYSNKRFKIPNALWAEINVDHQKEASRLAEHIVPGRGYPITQDIKCSTLETYTLTLTAQLEPLADNTTLRNSGGAAWHGYLALLAHATGLGCNYWAVTQDSENFSNNGVYRRTLQYTKTSCNKLAES